MTKLDYTTTVTTIDGEEKTLEEYEGKALLIVNTASECGFTPQYEGLEELWQKYRGDGLVVLGFPCNQFGNQEPGSNDEIAQFCKVNYGVSFPMHARIEVNGDDTHPLFEQLKEAAPGLLKTKAIKWNFTKFLVARDGTIVDRFGPKTAPGDIEADVVEQLRG